MASPVPDKNKPRPEKGQILLVIRKFPLWTLCMAPDILSVRRMRCGKMDGDRQLLREAYVATLVVLSLRRGGVC